MNTCSGGRICIVVCRARWRADLGNRVSIVVPISGAFLYTDSLRVEPIGVIGAVERYHT